MLVETYEIEEMKSSEATTMAADSNAIELIESLDLRGQRELCNMKTETRFPYPRLTEAQRAVFEVLYPQKTEVHRYKLGIFPVRVLQVMAYCKPFDETAYLEVWHATTQKEDPILVGRSSCYSSDDFLLARWGDALPAFEELAKKALPIIKDKMELEIRLATAKLLCYKESLDELARVYVASGTRPAWTFTD